MRITRGRKPNTFHIDGEGRALSYGDLWSQLMHLASDGTIHVTFTDHRGNETNHVSLRNELVFHSQLANTIRQYQVIAVPRNVSADGKLVVYQMSTEGDLITFVGMGGETVIYRIGDVVQTTV